jgi:hypothetical protein
MRSRRCLCTLGTLVVAAVLGACGIQGSRAGDATNGTSSAGTGAGGAGHEGHAPGGEPPLACLSSFIAEKCATSGCHDEQSRAYGMDLTNGASIFDAWVNRNGLDNCGTQLVPRVTPGDPDASFVYRKVTGQLSCVGSISQPMPPPPEPPLTGPEVAALRAWISSGAPKYCDAATLAPDYGGASSIAGASNVAGTTTSAGGTDGTAGTTSGVAGGPEVEDPFRCAADTPCISQLICYANDCSNEVWDCVTHRPRPESAGDSSLPPGYEPHHACPTDTMEYCGCDGVTFVAAVTCPDRPYQHPGACGDGYNCNPQDNVCGETAPTCEAGQAPSIVDECYASCVPVADCRCEFNWECPTGYQCDRIQWRCVVAQPVGGM